MAGSIDPFRQFRNAFGLENYMSVEEVRQNLMNHRQPIDLDESREYVEHFIKRCEKRDPTSMKQFQKRLSIVMNESQEMTLMMDFLVRCRQTHIFRQKTPLATADDSKSVSNMTTSSATPTPSVQSSPFQRRSASRGRVLSTLTGDQIAPNLNESITSRSRANSSFTSYDQRMNGMERQLAGSQRTRSPYGMSGLPTTRVSPLTASNQLFSASNIGYNTPSSSSHLRGIQTNAFLREESPNNQYARSNSNVQQQQYLRQTTTPTTSSHQMNVPVTSSSRSQINSKSNTPLHSRLGNAITETESTVCECLLSALIGMETRLFTRVHHKMAITSTASLSTSHHAVCQRVLSIANIYLLLSHKESPSSHSGDMHVTSALLAAIRHILGDYIGDVDELRRVKNLKFHHCLPLIDKWQTRLSIVAMAHKRRHMSQLDLLEHLFILHSAHCFEEDRRIILDKLLDYTMGVFCNQMMEWMTTGEVPAEKWMIEKDAQTAQVSLRKVPIFMTDTDSRILLEIGKSLPQVGAASDEDLEAIDRATTVVKAALSPKLIFKDELTPILMILRDVVCGIVMRMVLTTGRLKEHIHKATSFFFLSDPRFTATLYNIIKEASMGLRVGSASLSRQTVSSALAAALEATAVTQDKAKHKLKFTLDAITSLGSTPNVSSKMQFVQPLSPYYEPHMDLMKPIFAACNDDYESIFHVIWAIDLARFSSQETSTMNLPGIMRFLVKNYSLRENAACLLNMLSHIFLVVNSTLLRIRSIISVQLKQQLAQFLAALDERCVDVDDVIRVHQKFVRRVSVVVFVRNNEKIEHELASLLRVSFEAQDFVSEFSAAWQEVIDATITDENMRKAKIAELCQKRTIGARVLLETVNKCQKRLTELLDEQITYGNDALLQI